jgi:hypothetical protein
MLMKPNMKLSLFAASILALMKETSSIEDRFLRSRLVSASPSLDKCHCANRFFFICFSNSPWILPSLQTRNLQRTCDDPIDVLENGGPIVPDGSDADWRLTSDGVVQPLDASNTFFLANMYEAGNPRNDLLSRAYGSLDCAEKIFYVLVHVEGCSASSIETSLGDLWVKVYDVSNSPVPSINFNIVLENGVSKGWEAAYNMSAGAFNIAGEKCFGNVEIHANVPRGRTSSTGKRNVNPSDPIALHFNCFKEKSSASPSTQPSILQSVNPTSFPSQTPSFVISQSPRSLPSASPSSFPSRLQTMQQTALPSISSQAPTHLPSLSPSVYPSMAPVYQRSEKPSSSPSFNVPGDVPSVRPSSFVSMQSGQPSQSPVSISRSDPSYKPSDQPSIAPSSKSIVIPSQVDFPNSSFSGAPSDIPSDRPTRASAFTDQPNVEKQPFPSGAPSDVLSDQPSVSPVSMPMSQTSSMPVDTQACNNYCDGEYPYGCAENLDWPWKFMCAPNLQCYYSYTATDAGPYDE